MYTYISSTCRMKQRCHPWAALSLRSHPHRPIVIGSIIIIHNRYNPDASKPVTGAFRDFSALQRLSVCSLARSSSANDRPSSTPIVQAQLGLPAMNCQFHPLFALFPCSPPRDCSSTKVFASLHSPTPTYQPSSQTRYESPRFPPSSFKHLLPP